VVRQPAGALLRSARLHGANAVSGPSSEHHQGTIVYLI